MINFQNHYSHIATLASDKKMLTFKAFHKFQPLTPKISFLRFLAANQNRIIMMETTREILYELEE